MLEINISEGKLNRFKQAANILVGSATADWLVLLANLEGDVEVCEELYAQLEADIAAVGDWVAKDWLREYGVGEEAAKLRAKADRMQKTAALVSVGGVRMLLIDEVIAAATKNTEIFSALGTHLEISPRHVRPVPEQVLLKHPLQEVFDAVIAQVTTGKGQRHGGGEQPFYEQPWFTTTQQVGIGFPLGQAMKKLGESSSKPDAESFETELLGAIAYAAMGYLANKKLAVKS